MVSSLEFWISGEVFNAKRCFSSCSQVEPQSNGVSASSDVQYAVPCVKTSSTSPTVHSQDDSGFCFQVG